MVIPENYNFIIKSEKTRNLLRGLIGVDEKYKVDKTLTKLRRNSSYADYINSIAVIRSSSLFEKNCFYRDFIDHFLMKSEGVNSSSIFPVQIILKSIENNKSELLIVLKKYRELLTLVQKSDIEGSIEFINSLIDKKHLSLFLIKVLFFIKNNIEDSRQNKSIIDDLEKILKRVNIGNINCIENAIRELINPKTEYLNIHQRIKGSICEYSMNGVVKSFVYPVPRTKNEFEDVASGYYELSLTDSLLYLMRAFKEIPAFFDYPIEIDVSLIEEYERISSLKISNSSIVNSTPTKEVQNFFKESFLLVDLDECFNYRVIHCALYNKSQNKFSEISIFEYSLINRYFNGLTSLKDISYKDDNSLNVDQFNPKSCCLLENSTALVYVLNKLNGDIVGHEEEFVELMSYTKNIGLICPQTYLLNITDKATSDELKLISSCLSVISDKNDISEHDLRSTIEEIAESKELDLLGLIQYLYPISAAVSLHLIDTCDEYFISTLFELTDKPIKATETRANILEWFGNETGDSAFLERARSLKVELQISKYRDTIDDSRIYAEPFKYTQWLTNNILDDIILILEKSDSEIILETVKVDWTKVSTSLNPIEAIGYQLLRGYREFCENKLFGVASYLGRRIRHGTFEGTASKEVKDIVDNIRYSELFKNKSFEGAFEKWLNEYEKMVDELKQDYLHINDSTHKHGLIFPGFDTVPKYTVANAMFREVCLAYYENESVSSLPYLILDYCWQFIESDLTKIKSFLDEKKSINGHFHYESSAFNGQTRKLFHEFKKEVNSIITDKFRTISSWFNKPSYAASSVKTDLLFNAVIAEVKESIVGFNPKILLEGTSYVLHGQDSYVLYDALYVLIVNAAENGIKDGIIKFITEANKEGMYLKTTVISQVDCEKNLNNAKSEIQMKLGSLDCPGVQDAHVSEKGSGIKKLKLLERSGEIKDISYDFDNTKNLISASFNLHVEFV